jgi:hypothetical protein
MLEKPHVDTPTILANLGLQLPLQGTRHDNEIFLGAPGQPIHQLHSTKWPHSMSLGVESSCQDLSEFLSHQIMKEDKTIVLSH